MQRMGYSVEQWHMTATYLSTFATVEAIAGYHSAETLEQDLRQSADRQLEIVELHEVGRSFENHLHASGGEHGRSKKVCNCTAIPGQKSASIMLDRWNFGTMPLLLPVKARIVGG